MRVPLFPGWFIYVYFMENPNLNWMIWRYHEVPPANLLKKTFAKHPYGSTLEATPGKVEVKLLPVRSLFKLWSARKNQNHAHDGSVCMVD